ncbi:MAG: hypothetical protein J2P59_00895 [Acidimicrobiales bacterium]|nr:hypothetical protein [Acidimicrobiales bacterium]
MASPRGGDHLGEGRPGPSGPIPGERPRPRLEPEAAILPVVDHLVLVDGDLASGSAGTKAGVAVIDPCGVPGFDTAMARAAHPRWSLRAALTTSWHLGGSPPRLTLDLELRPLRRPWQRLAARVVFDVDGCRDWLTLALGHRIALVTLDADGTPDAESLRRRAVDVTPSEQEKRLLLEVISRT